jgi:hypothetical protein
LHFIYIQDYFLGPIGARRAVLPRSGTPCVSGSPFRGPQGHLFYNADRGFFGLLTSLSQPIAALNSVIAILLSFGPSLPPLYGFGNNDVAINVGALCALACGHNKITSPFYTFF